MAEGLEIKITFPGQKRVVADFGSFVIPTDQTIANGGKGSAPEPYNLFLASIGTCAGFYVVAFCETRNIPSENIHLIQRHEFKEPGHLLSKVELEIQVPQDFPKKYHKALIQAVNTCAVKKALSSAPEFIVATKVVDQK